MAMTMHALPDVRAHAIAECLREQADLLELYASLFDCYAQHRGTNGEDGITLWPSHDRLTIHFHGDLEHQQILVRVFMDQLGGAWEIRSDEDAYKATRRVEGSVTVVLWADGDADADR